MSSFYYDPQNAPPEASAQARHLTLRLLRPLERFIHIQAASGILLLIIAVIALVWANSRWAPLYDAILHTPITLALGDFNFTRDVHFWVNDILMVFFFFLVGLEIRREIYSGQLSNAKQAALPVAAAVGGMIAPALIYFFFNGDLPSAHGWGVPMATDIAFAVGVIALLGKRVPSDLRIFLLAVAIIDDIGAILVIALFYSEQIVVAGVVGSGAGIALVIFMQRIGIREPLIYVVPGIIIWVGAYVSGIHPTVAGVVLGLLTPARAWFGHEGFLAEIGQTISELREKLIEPEDSHSILPYLRRVDQARREAVAPVIRIEAALHPWVAFIIMPIFALANAGVSIGTLDFSNPSANAIATGIGLGLVFGKPIGIILFSWLSVKLGIAKLPCSINWTGIFVVGCISGIGFTMALFIALLAFSDPAMLSIAKVSILSASAIAGIVGLLLGFKLLPKN